jgi:hypothetical protein
MTAAAIDSRERADTAEKHVTFVNNGHDPTLPFARMLQLRRKPIIKFFRNANNINGAHRIEPVSDMYKTATACQSTTTCTTEVWLTAKL